MAWTQYHDALLQELTTLMSEPEWYNIPAITGRINTITTALTTEANTGTTLPVRNNNNGEIEQQSVANVLASLINRMEEEKTAGKAATEARYSDVLAGYGGRASDVLGASAPSFTGVGAQYDTDLAAAISELQDRKSTIGGNIGTAASTLNTDLSGVTGGYASRETTLSSLLNNLGDVARQNVRDTYGAERGRVEQDMTNRGLGNTTIRTSAMGGVADKEARAMAELDEQLRREKADYLGQWSGDTLNARMQAAGQVFAGGMQAADSKAGLSMDVAKQLADRAAGKQAMGMEGLGLRADLTGQTLGFQASRKDMLPSLADIANLTLQSGRPLSQFSLLSAYQPYTTFGQ